MSDEMEPILLIASPQMSDPMFRETVVLVWQRDEEGAIGVVINRSLEHRLLDVVEFDEEVDSERYGQTCISWGGPVEGTTGTVVTTELQENTQHLRTVGAAAVGFLSSFKEHRGELSGPCKA